MYENNMKILSLQIFTARVLQEGLPGVYSSVSFHREWIDSNIQSNGGGEFCDV